MLSEPFVGGDAIQKILITPPVGNDRTLNAAHTRAATQLTNAGFEIQNNNGKTRFGLTTIENTVVKVGDAFVFLPIPEQIPVLRAKHADELFRVGFKAASLFVGGQTNDPNLHILNNPELANKPVILFNKNKCYDWFLSIVDHLVDMGTIKPHQRALFQEVETQEQMMEVLKNAHTKKTQDMATHGTVKVQQTKEEIEAQQADPDEKRKPDFNVCVFCSASTKNQELLDIAYKVGHDIASQGWGVISGLGRESMMGKVCEGATHVINTQGKGWVGGSNLQRIIQYEGLPDHYDKIWLKDDIYNRMDAMIKNSQGFVIMPGGMGTVQEMMALLSLRHSKVPEEAALMRDEKGGRKPIIVVNQELEKDGEKKKFWKPVIEMANRFGFKDDIIVVNTVEEAMEKLKTYKAELGQAAAR